jgi:predicted nucleic acid-binding protein
MILLDSDVMIDLLRQYPPAVEWFDTLEDEEEIILPGYVVMELIQGCRNKTEQERLQHTRQARDAQPLRCAPRLR